MNSKQLFKTEYELSFDNNDNFQVRLNLYKPNPEKPGLLTLDRILTNAEVEEQILNALRQIILTDKNNEVMNAYQCAEYVMYNKHQEEFKSDALFPYHDSHIIVSCGYGHCEGQRISIMARDSKSGDYKQFCSIKYLIGLQDASRISLALNEAFHNGLFN
ncbi:TPA: hypothetical protein RI785_002314 [Vibrio cholerae]|uniref:Uncharacterized protein n=1 Tax=Vibrio cholerae TaxID=666 RepID=A0A5Q6PE23_VIBCL|nr:hypothetical protein [Vibrio cholerae]KAA1253118.1 hypothetical protein F0M16_19450 [Vibrio cholerae]HDV5593596.1 hypothetical protein [Vibrio cholerae]